MELLVEASDLKAMLEKGPVQIIDATYFLPQHGRDAFMEYADGHLPGALLLDFYIVSDRTSKLPTMLPSADDFAVHVTTLGIKREKPIIIYDNSPLHSAARAWWMFRVFGAPEVAILNGGKAAWVAAGGALETGSGKFFTGRFPISENRASVVALPEMREIVAGHTMQVLDARGPDRFTGAEPETRADMRSGHMPGARNLPNGSLFAEDGRYKDKDGLRAAFAAAGADPLKPLVATCGSGVTAANIFFAATLLGAEAPRLYDGSWAEWGGRYDTDIVRGPAD